MLRASWALSGTCQETGSAGSWWPSSCQGTRVRMTRQLRGEGWGRPCTGHVPPSGLFSLSTQCVCPSPGGGRPAQVPQPAAKRHGCLPAALAGREEAGSRWTLCRDRFPWSWLQGRVRSFLQGQGWPRAPAPSPWTCPFAGTETWAKHVVLRVFCGFHNM